MHVELNRACFEVFSQYANNNENDIGGTHQLSVSGGRSTGRWDELWT